VRSAATEALGSDAVVVVVVVAGAGATVVVVALGADTGGASAPPDAPVARCEDATSVTPAGGRVAMVVVVVVDVDGDGPDRASWPGSVTPPVRRAMWAAAWDEAPSRRGVEDLLPAVATRRAIRPSETARMTHQLGRPRPTLERKPSVGSGPPPNTGTGTRYARVTLFALAGQAHSRR
jgi:hypothetical protein